MKDLLVSEHILVFAFRYALGRRTAAASIVVDQLEKHWTSLEPHTRAQIRREISQAIAFGEAGAHCDVDTWKRVLGWDVDE